MKTEKMKDGFRWPKQADGSEPTRQQVLEEARKLTENNGIQLMHDGITFKIRVPSGKEAAKCQFRGRRASRINSKSSDRAGHETTLGWDVKVVRVILRNKGKEATKRAFLKCAGRPAADTIEVGGKMVVLRAQAEKEKDVDQQD